MRDLTDPRWMLVKAVLFAVAGLMCVTGILVQLPDWRTALLLLVGIISFCRLYYFAFYVIERYINADYKFAGLWSAGRWLWQHRHELGRSAPDAHLAK